MELESCLNLYEHSTTYSPTCQFSPVPWCCASRWRRAGTKITIIHQFNIDSTNDDPNNIDISNDNNNINESNDETVGEPDDNMDNNDSQGEASSSGDNGTGDNGSGYEDTNNNKVDDIPPKKTTKQKMKGQLELSTFHDFWEKLLAKQPNAKYVERS